MNILITGNLGYVGPVVVKHLKKRFPECKLSGIDLGFFSNSITSGNILPDIGIDLQIYKDVRDLVLEDLEGFHSIVYLSAVSNDPMGSEFEDVTYEINQNAAVRCAILAKEANVKNFIFASSCSVYGAAGDGYKTEDSELNPLTAYAKSKIEAEKELLKIANSKFNITCLRFATACGFSSRLRLDLVINDFVAAALINKEIQILSDGSPWRPLIHVKDMAKAIEWSIIRKDLGVENNYLALNIGSNKWNYQVKELAYSIERIIEGIKISINKNAIPDKRSYKVSFDLFHKLAPDHQPTITLDEAIIDLVNGLKEINFSDVDYRNSNLIRLNVLKDLTKNKLIDNKLKWNLYDI